MRLDPTPHPSLVLEVLLAEDALQVAFFALDHPALHEDEDEGEQQGAPGRVGERCNPAIYQREPEVNGVAGEALGSFGHDTCRRLVRSHVRLRATQSAEAGDEQQ